MGTNAWKRAEILRIIKDNEPLTVTQLGKILNISLGSSIYRYLNELEERGLIELTKDSKKRGQPAFIKTTPKADPISKGVFDMVNKMFKGSPVDDGSSNSHEPKGDEASTNTT